MMAAMMGWVWRARIGEARLVMRGSRGDSVVGGGGGGGRCYLGRVRWRDGNLGGVDGVRVWSWDGDIDRVGFRPALY